MLKDEPDDVRRRAAEIVRQAFKKTSYTDAIGNLLVV